MAPLLLALLCVATPDAAAPAAESPPALEAAQGPTRFRAALEASALSFPSGTTGGGQDLFAALLPLFAIDGGDELGFELGATLRLRLFDNPPEQKPTDYGHLLRKEDWDEPSDFGQLLRELRIGGDASVVSLRAGPLNDVTLGSGHLLSRYSNALNPNYHPAGAVLSLQLPLLRLQVLASDVLAARLFAAELSADLGRIFSSNPDRFDRFQLALSGAYDAGLAGGSSPSVGLMQVDFSAAVYRAEEVKLFAITGAGTRLGAVGESGFGALLGLLADGKVSETELSGRLEVRKQSRGFRHGFFSADYELARFSATGLSREPLAAQVLPDSASVAAELRVTLPPKSEGLAAPLSLGVGAERFFWGRTDLDGSATSALLDGKLAVTARLAVTGLQTAAPRYFLEAEARLRVLAALYVLGSGGTVFFPEPREATDTPGLREACTPA